MSLRQACMQYLAVAKRYFLSRKADEVAKLHDQRNCGGQDLLMPRYVERLTRAKTHLISRVIWGNTTHRWNTQFPAPHFLKDVADGLQVRVFRA
jgi:hypothetical protein